MNKDQVKRDAIRKIMGWVAKYPKREPGDHFSAAGDAWRYGMVKPRLPNGMLEEDFHPTFKISHAYMVVDRMRELGYYMQRTSKPRPIGVTIHFCRAEDFGDIIEDSELVRVDYTEEPLGICMAALNALKEKD